MDPLSVVALLDEPATYVGWGWLTVSVPNLAVILLMILVFVLAIVLPFPKGKDES